MAGITLAQKARLTTVLNDLAPRGISEEGLNSVAVKFLERLHEAQEAIDQKYHILGGAPGKPTTDIEFGAGDGYYRRYEQGAIYWHSQLGAHEIHGAIRDKWYSLGGKDLVDALISDNLVGFPITDEIKLPDGIGRLNHFQNSSIYWTPNTGAWMVHGAIRDKWAAMGWQDSYLGYPTTDEIPWTHPNTKEPGRISFFERGAIAWASHSGAFDLPDTIILRSGPVNPPEPITGWAELIINSAGGYCYRGHLHNSGAISYHIAIASALNFRDSDGNVFVATEEGYPSGAGPFGDRDHDWEHVGFEQRLRDNFDALRSLNTLPTTLKVNVTVGDVVEAVLVNLPYVALAAGVVFIISLFASGKAKLCPGMYVQHTDPETGEQKQEWSYPIVGPDDPCPSQ